jgi:hypothetical protein
MRGPSFRDRVKVVRTQHDRRANAKAREAGPCRPAGELAAKRAALVAGDSHSQQLERIRVGNERDAEEPSGLEPADLFAELDVVDALTAARISSMFSVRTQFGTRGSFRFTGISTAA